MTSASDKDRPLVLMTGSYPDWDMEAMQEKYRIARLWEAKDRDAFLAEHAPEVKAIATRGDLGASGELIAALPHLEIIACYGVGTDAIDLPAAKARNIPVTNTPDVLTGDVADMAVGLALGALRGLAKGDTHARSDAWAKGGMALQRRFFGRRVGILGYGRIGAAVAKRMAGFDMEIGYFARSKRPDAGDHPFFDRPVALARWCDILIVTLAGGASTKHMVNAEVLAALGADGVLVNVARGSTVDEAALLDALEKHTILGAGLDVFDNEPNIDGRFAKLDNVLLQPHQGSGTVETRKVMGQLVRDNLQAHFNGQPLPTPVK